jgi:hypothetical protein
LGTILGTKLKKAFRTVSLQIPALEPLERAGYFHKDKPISERVIVAAASPEEAAQNTSPIVFLFNRV